MAFSSSLSASLFFSIVCLSVTIAQAKEFIVGGTTNAWTVPTSSSYTLNKWAEANRFQVGDSLGNKPFTFLFFFFRFNTPLKLEMKNKKNQSILNPTFFFLLPSYFFFSIRRENFPFFITIIHYLCPFKI